MAEQQAVLYVNGRRRLLPRDRAQQTLLSYLRGARPTCLPSGAPLVLLFS